MINIFIRFINALICKVNTLFCKWRIKSLGKATTIAFPIHLHGEKFIEIGSKVYIGRNSWLNVVKLSKKMNTAIFIGNGTSISGECCISAAKSIVIEENVLIGRFTHISDHSHAFDSIKLPVKSQGISEPKPVRIKCGAWFGQGVVICPGVTIGKNAVIGANSVVKNDVPDYCVAAGIPAKVIKDLSV